VGIWSPNAAEWVLIQFATAKIGAILVNINPAYRAHELAYVLDQSGVRLLVHADATAQSDYPRLVRDVAPSCPACEQTVTIGSAS
jgi:fatty-acyl-CoA synthase